MKRYAACTSEEEVKKAEEVWLAKIEREYSESRAEGAAAGNDDAWKGGNMNRRPVVDSDEEDDDEEDSNEEGDENDEDDDDGGVSVDKNLLDISDESDDEEEMAELRRRVLQSKPFVNPAPPDSTHKPAPQIITRPAPALPVDSDAESGSDIGDNDDFDNIINATPVTDRTGIQAKQRLKSEDGEKVSAMFSRSVVGAPKRW